MRAKVFAFVVFALAFVVASPGRGQPVPDLINYQGRLMDSSGAPVSGPVEMQFRITDTQYDQESIVDEPHLLHGLSPEPLLHDDLASGSEMVTDLSGNTVYTEGIDYHIDYLLGAIQRASGGAIPDPGDVLVDYTYNTDVTVLWSDTVYSVQVENGLYSVVLGQGNTALVSVFAGSDRFLEVNVEGERLAPRQRITGTAYSFRADSVSDGAIHQAQLADSAVTSIKVQDGSITGDDLDTQTITGANIADATISGVHVGDTTLTGAHIKDDSIGADQVQDIYLMNTGDTVTGDLECSADLEVIGNAFVNLDIDVGASGSFGGDLTVSGGNIGLSTSPSSSYGIRNSSSSAPTYGARLYGSSEAIRGVWSGDVLDNYAYLGSDDYGIYARAGDSGRTGSKYGGRFLGVTQGNAYGVYGKGYGYGSGIACGINGYGQNGSTGDVYGGRFSTDPGGSGEHFGVWAEGWASSSSTSYGVKGYGYNDLSGDVYGGHFSTSASGSGNHYGVYAKSDGYGVYAAWTDYFDHYAFLGSENYGIYGSCGSSDETGTRWGGFLTASSQGYSYGVRGNANSHGSDAAHGVYGYGNNDSTGPAYGGYFETTANGSGDHYGVYGASDGYPGYFALSSDPADHFAHLGSLDYGVYAKSGNSDETAARYGAKFEAVSQAETCGVYGYADGASVNPSYGVKGYAHTYPSGDAYGGYFEGAANGAGTHYGVYAESDSYPGYFANVLDPADHFAHLGSMSYGVYGKSGASDETGSRYGAKFEAKTQGQAQGVYAVADGHGSSHSYGVSGAGRNYSSGNAYGGYFSAANEGTGSHFGVYGESHDVGVYGAWAKDADNHYACLGAEEFGVYARSGDSDETAARAGGQFYSYTHGNSYAVRGNAYGYGKGHAYGVYGYASNSGTGNAYGIYNAAGTKNWVNPDPEDPEKSIVYATLEGGENGTYWRGRAKLENGRAVVELPDHFRKVTSPDHPVTVQVTPRSAESLGLAVTKSTNSEIVVQELQGGSGDYEFDCLVQGKRLGYEDYEPVIDNVDYVPFQGNHRHMDQAGMTTQEWYDSQSEGLKRIFMMNGMLDDSGKVNEELFRQKGWKINSGDTIHKLQ